MSKKYAEFVKCALQVNPYNYIKYRGENQTLQEDEYNENILKVCKEQDIKVVGLADHGNAHSSESLRKLLSENGVVVFPGFEICTAEKIHIVCLFPENTSASQLDRYLGQLGLIDEQDGTSPSNMSCKDIGRKVNQELNGFWYAAHITSDNGILKIGQLHNTWISEYLVAAQIPSTRANLDFNYKTIIENKDPNYLRAQPVALINAKDVSKPSDLATPEASCLIKMSNVDFSCFKNAFNDPDSRVRLVTELDTNHHSVIKKVKISGGYLDEFNVDLSQNLNTIIGGRGTGKSTLIELLRYALDKKPISTQTQLSSRNLIASNIGIASGKVELLISSNQQHGKDFKIIKRYDEPIVITNIDGTSSNLNLEDIMPSIEIIGQNEILELIEDEEAKIQILNRFLPDIDSLYEEEKKILRDLKQNRETLIHVKDSLEELSSQIQLLPSLKEKMDTFEEMGIKEKLKLSDKISVESQYFNSVFIEIQKDSEQLPFITPPFSSADINDTLNKDIFISLDEIFTETNSKIEKLNSDYKELIQKTEEKVEALNENWKTKKLKVDSEIQRAIKLIPDIHGKSGGEIAEEFKNTSKKIAQITPLSIQEKEVSRRLEQLTNERNSLLEQLRTCKDNIRQSLLKTIKKVNKGALKGKIKVELLPNKNRENLRKFICDLPGFGPKTVEWISSSENLSITSLRHEIDNGVSSLLEKYKNYGLTETKAEVLASMSFEQKLCLEETKLQDTIDIQLNVSPHRESFKSLHRLSKGQQCTAILNLLLLENKDPLIIDQPEDNLDNAFIANNIVSELREHKMKRQFIFATHNANIPVFGDSELIIVMNEEDGQGGTSEDFLGSIDAEIVKQSVIRTLEGGDNAFRMRRLKYDL